MLRGCPAIPVGHFNLTICHLALASTPKSARMKAKSVSVREFMLAARLALALVFWSLSFVAISDDSDDMIMPHRLPPPVDTQQQTSAFSRMGGDALMSQPLSTNQVDVMFLYAEDAVRLYGSNANVHSRITAILNYANTVYANSNVNIVLNNAGEHLVYYDNGNITATAFNHLTNKSHPAFAQVNLWRMQDQADIVVLLRPRKSDTATCGKAYLNGGGLASPESTFWTMGGYAYAHVSINCYDFVLAHELGHVMGLVHTRADSNSRPYAYGAGYKINNDFSTVMASTKAYDPPPSTLAVPYFSSPTLTCTGYANTPAPCGIDSSLPNGADAALALNNIAAQVALFSDDGDNDGMPDWFEHFWGLDRFNPADASTDADGDGLNNLAEFYSESYPKPNATYGITLAQARDTDADGVLDGLDPYPTLAGSPVLELNGQYRGSIVQDTNQQP